MKKIVELQNPSDPITFEMDDVKVAGAAILILGSGAYGLEDDTGTVVPIMLFGNHERWLKENKITDLGAFIGENLLPMAEFLESCCYGRREEREAVEVACSRMTTEKAMEHRAWWNDKKRSSLNNIGRGALKLAAQFRKQAARNPICEPLTKAAPIILAQ